MYLTSIKLFSFNTFLGLCYCIYEMQNMKIPMSYLPGIGCLHRRVIKIMRICNNQNYVLLYWTCAYVKEVINGCYLSLLSK